MFQVTFADQVEAETMKEHGRYKTYDEAYRVCDSLCQDHTLVVLYHICGEDSRGNFRFKCWKVWEYGEVSFNL